MSNQVLAEYFIGCLMQLLHVKANTAGAGSGGGADKLPVLAALEEGDENIIASTGDDCKYEKELEERIATDAGVFSHIRRITPQERDKLVDEFTALGDIDSDDSTRFQICRKLIENTETAIACLQANRPVVQELRRQLRC